MKCNIVLKVNDISYEFSSEQELNEKLLELLSTEALNTPSISHVRWSISEAPSAERTDHLLGEIRSRVNERGYEIEKKKMIVSDPDNEFEDEHIKINGATSVTSLPELKRGVSNTSMVTPYEERKPTIKKNWINNHIQNNKSGIKRTASMSDTEYHNILVEAAERGWTKSDLLIETSSLFGSWYHALIQAAFNGEDIKSVKLPSILNLQSDFLTEVYNSVIKLKQELMTRHPGAKFYSEYTIVSKDVSGDLRKMMGDNDLVGGTIDLLVREENGDTYIYDFKTSSHPMIVGNKTNESWSVDKIKRTLYQLESYAQILKQYGIKVNAKYIIPIYIEKINPEEYTISEIEARQKDGKPIQMVNSVEIGGRAADGFPMTFISEGDLLSSVSDSNAEQIRSDLKDIRSWFNVKKITQSEDLVAFSNKLQMLMPIGDSIHIVDNITGGKDKDSFLEKRLFVELTEEKDPDRYRNGYRWKIDLRKHKIQNSSQLQFGIEQIQNNVVYFTNEQKEQWKSTIFDVYRAERQKLFSDLYETIHSITSKKDEAEFETFIHSWGKKSPWLAVILRPYLLGQGWNLYSDETLAANGFYIFEKNGVFEFVMISDEDLNKKYDFSHSKLSLHVGQNATTVAGNFFKDEDVHNRNVLNATAGHFLLMKAALYISEHYSDFKDYKINTIRAINIERGQHQMVSNTEIIDSWTEIAYGALQQGIRINNLPNVFAKDWEAFYNLADDLAAIMMNVQYKEWMDGYQNFEPQDYLKNIQTLLTKQMQRRLLISDFTEEKVMELNTLVAYLEKALLSLQHYNFRHEGDITQIESEITAPANSSKYNQQLLNSLISEYNFTIRTEFKDISRKWRALLKEALQEAGIGDMGNEIDMFRQWLNPDETLQLRTATDSFWKGRPKQYAAYNFFVETINKYAPTSEEEGSVNLNIPLVKGNFINRLAEEGFFGALESNLGDLYEIFKSPFMDELDDPDRRALIHSDETVREEWINEKGVGYFALNLDQVFNFTMQQEIQKKYRKHYEIYFSSVQTTLNFMSQFDNFNWDVTNEDKNPLANLIKYTKDYLNSRGRGKSLIEDKQLRRWYRVLSKLSQSNSFVQLAANTRTLAREFLTSSAIGLTRANAELMPGVTVKTWLEAMQLVILSDHWTSMDSFVNQLNLRFGAANMDISQLADAVKYAKWNPHNLKKNRAYVTSSLTDFIVRNGIFLAKMLSDGVVNKDGSGAYHLDASGELIYDFNLDPRFDALRKWDTKHPKFYEQLALYNAIAEDLNLRILHSDGNGDVSKLYKKLDITNSAEDVKPLFEGYLRSEIAGVRNHADTLYGHYNDENQMLVQDKFLGHFIMSFKTYVSSRIEQNFSGAIHTNVPRFAIRTNEKGEELYIKTKDNGEMSIVPRSEVTDEELRSGMAKPYMTMLLMNHQGIINNLIGMGRAMAHWKDDKEGWHKWWAKPMHRALFLLFLEDTLLTLILMMLTNLIFGFEANTKFNRMNSETWLKRWSYSVAMGAFKDGPFTNVLHQMSDINPPLIGAIQDWYSGAVDVITGQDNFLHAFTQNIGAFREFSGYFELDDK